MTQPLLQLDKKTFHHGSVETSPRLKKLLSFLKSRGPAGATTFEITIACHTTRASSDCSELRACGVGIVAEEEECTLTGRRVFRYRLL